MLDSDTKRRIDTARDILVGKVPDPKSQVEQITIALIYKFMDDMDAQAEELGGKRKFFTGEFAKYGWAKLMTPAIGGHELIGLYGEGIATMPQNPGIPPLFRDIFKNAYLPYRDPETLKAFLKTIDGFSYDHSERLGDAFEYLLSVLGSQGDAGQFRTPRHIIDFVVSIVDPKKNETVLDPACGTAGFLISAYKHLLRANSTPAAIDKVNGAGEAALHTSKIPAAKGDMLTPDERKKLAANFIGYDISPDMVRLSLVNLYLHNLNDPHIHEYDSLTSQDRWNEYADVILANPPFMSPKGGIKPHNRFSVQSKRSEVLFVDYMAEHLTPGGRAGIIVPEGIIFQSQTAYKALRKMLVEQYLVAVVSLPAGVFNPYSGVKTSILILDKSLAKQSDMVGFFKVENDGFNLGAQRRPIDKNDLPQVLAEIEEYLRRLRAKESVAAEAFTPTRGLIVAKEKIAANGDFNLSGERYRENVASNTVYPLVPVGQFMKEEVQTIDPRGTPDELFELWSIPAHDAGKPEMLKGADIGSQKKLVAPGDVLLSRIIPHIRRGRVVPTNSGAKQIASTEWIVFSSDAVEPAYLRQLLVSDIFHSSFMQTITGVGGSLSRANPKAVGEIRIPLPPLEVQKEIVAEIEAYQKVIDGARAVLDHYRPHIPINPEWPMVALGEICDFKNGLNFAQGEDGTPIRIVGVKDFQKNLTVPLDDLVTVKIQGVALTYLLEQGDILFVRSNGNPDLVGRSMIFPATDEAIGFSGFIIRGRMKDKCKTSPLFYAHYFKSRDFADAIKSSGSGAGISNLSQDILGRMRLPLPPLSEQEKIVAEIEAEQRLVEGNRQLIERMERKIAAVLARIWGDAPTAPAEPIDDDRSDSTVELKPFSHGLPDELDKAERYLKNATTVACLVIRKLGSRKGKTFVEKNLHVVESFCDVSMGRHPRRMEHGPADLAQHDRIMDWAANADAFLTDTTPDGKRVTYTRGAAFDLFVAAADVVLGERRATVESLVDKLSKLDSKQAEWIATAYGSWNDLIKSGVAQPLDAQIIQDIYTNWHVSKQDVKEPEWKWALNWLRQNAVVPSGKGPRVVPSA